MWRGTSDSKDLICPRALSFDLIFYIGYFYGCGIREIQFSAWSVFPFILNLPWIEWSWAISVDEIDLMPIVWHLRFHLTVCLVENQMKLGHSSWWNWSYGDWLASLIFILMYVLLKTKWNWAISVHEIDPMPIDWCLWFHLNVWIIQIRWSLAFSFDETDPMIIG